MIIREYSNLIDNIDQVKALKQKEEFYSENGLYDSVLCTYKMCEIFSENINFNEEVINKVLRKAMNLYMNSYCVFLSDVDYTTRIRSYQGFINVKLKNSIEDYKEWEIDTDNNKSFFIGIVNLKSNYQNIFDNLLFYSGRCFIFCTNECTDNELYVEKILTKKGMCNAIFNYYYLIQSFINKDELIIRAAGSDLENGVQIFAKKENYFLI